MPFKRFLLGLAATGAVGLAATGAGAAPPPYTPPVALQDIGAPRACPMILVESGQSNREGFDPGGGKTIPAGVFITNADASPANPVTPVTATALVQAAFGTEPLNRGLNGVSSATNSYNNSGVQHAANLVRGGYAPLVNGVGVVVVANWFPGQSISQWVGTTPGVMDPTAPYWQHLLGQLAVVQAAYPGCPITEFDWDQGEADSNNAVSTPYNSAATYQAGLSTLIAAVRGLTVNGQAMWNTDPTKGRLSFVTLQELATWGANAVNSSRNDVIDTYRGGARDPLIDVVPVDGLTESLVNPGPHFDGASLVTIGGRLTEVFKHARAGGGYGDRANGQTQFGSADAFRNAIQGPPAVSLTGSIAGNTLTITALSGTIAAGAPSGSMIYGAGVTPVEILAQLSGTAGGTGTYQLAGAAQSVASEAMTVGHLYGTADLRTGAYIVANGGTIALPHPQSFASRPVTVTVQVNTASVLDTTASGSSLYLEGAGTSVTSFGVGSPNVYDLIPVQNAPGIFQWRMRQVFPVVGVSQRYTPNAPLGGTAALTSGYNRFSFFTLNGTAVTLTPVPGAELDFYNASTTTAGSLAITPANEQAGARILQLDGTTLDTGAAGGNAYPIPPGALVKTLVDYAYNVVITVDSSRTAVTTQQITTAGTITKGAAAKTFTLDIFGPGGAGGNGASLATNQSGSGGGGGGAGGHNKVGPIPWSACGTSLTVNFSATLSSVTCGTTIWRAAAGGSGGNGASGALAAGGGGAGLQSSGGAASGSTAGVAGTPGGTAGGTTGAAPAAGYGMGPGGGPSSAAGVGTNGTYGISAPGSGGGGAGCSAGTAGGNGAGNDGSGPATAGAAGNSPPNSAGAGGGGGPANASGAGSNGGAGGARGGGGGGGGSSCNGGAGGTGGAGGPGEVDISQW